MTRSQVSAIVVAALAATTAPLPAAAQEYPPGFNERVLYITKPHLEALFRGMDAELAMRAELKKEIAKYGTPQKYEACTANAAMSPEAQKIMAAMTDVPANATAEEAQRHMAKKSAEMEELVKRACPLNPSYWNDVVKRERLEEILRKAAAIAFPAPTSSSTNPVGSVPDGLLFEVFPEDQAPSAADTIVSPETAWRLRLDWYLVLKERLVAYCHYMAGGELPRWAEPDPSNPTPRTNARTASAAGLKIPGYRDGNYWVFTPREATLLAQYDCKAWMQKYAEAIE